MNKKHLVASIGLTGVLASMTTAVQAETTEFNFFGLTDLLEVQIEESFSFEEDGINLDVTAFYTEDGATNPADVTLQYDGLGVKGPGRTVGFGRFSTTIPDPNQVDGYNHQLESLSLAFDPNVKVDYITFARAFTDDDTEVTIDGTSIYNGAIPASLLTLGIGTIHIDDSPFGAVVNIGVTENMDGFLGTDGFVVKKIGVTAVPEPLTILGAGTAIAFGAKFKRKLASKKG